MVSKNNRQWKQQRDAQRVPHYGLRKLSVGVASVLLSTTLYMGVTAHADTVTTPSETAVPTTAVATDSTTPTTTTETVSGNSASNVGDEKSNQTNKANENQALPANTDSNGKTEAQPVVATPNTSEVTPSEKGVMDAIKPAANAKAMETNDLASNSSVPQLSSAKPTEQPTDTNHNSVTTLNTTCSWTIHYNDENGKALLPDSVITHDYTRTDTGNQMGNWSYVPDSVNVTGTPNNGWHIDNPNFKFDQAAGGTTFDFSTWQAAAASIDGYTPNYGSVALTDQLPKNPESLHATTTVDSGKHEFTFVYTQQPKTVKINYVNDDDNETVVKTDSVSGKLNTAVTITPNLPSGYMLTPGKDVPNTYTLTDANNQALTIHVQKQFVDVSDTDPQAKQTRTITLHYVYAGGSKNGQKAFDDAVLDIYYHRTATFDRVTNQTTYGDWMWDESQGDTSTPGYHVVSGKWTNLPQSWATVTADVPSIKGYYADLGQNDPTNTNHVPANTWVFPTYNNAAGGGISDSNKGATAYLDGQGYEVSPTHTIKYMPSKTTVTVNYVDDDNNKANVGSQHWDGTTGQHIDLTLTPPANYVLSPGWVNPSSYDFDGVNSSWFTVHVKHATQDVTDQQPADQVTKVTQLTRNHLYGDGPHKGEKFGEPDIFDLAWKRTATKDLVTNKVTFGDWKVDRDNSKNVQGSLHLYDDNSVGGGLYIRQNGYSYLGQNSHQEFISADGSTITNWNTYYGWYPDQASKYSTVNYYYGPEQVNIPVYYIDADTGEQVGQKTSWSRDDGALTGPDYLDGNTVAIDQSKLTSLPILTGYQLLPGQTFPTSYKIDTFAGVKGIKVQVVKDRSVKITFVDDDNKEAVVGTPTTITGHTGGDPVTLNLTVPDKYELADGQQLPTSYTFTKGSGDVVVHLKHPRNTTQEEKTVTRKVTITTPDGKSTVTNQTVTFTRDSTVDEVTGNVTYGPWSENGKYTFAAVDVPNVPGYTATGDVPSLTVTPDSKDTDVTINYTANQRSTQIVFVDKDGKTVDTVDVNGKTGETVETNAKVPDKWKLVDNETVPSTITFSADTPKTLTVHVEHKIETRQLKINTNVLFPRFIKVSYDTSSYNEGYSTWITDDEFNDGYAGYVAWKNDEDDDDASNLMNEFWLGKPTDAGSVIGSVQYDLVSGEIVKVNNGETLKFGKLFNYPSYDDVANGGSLAPGDLNSTPTKETFTDMLNGITHENLNYKVYASANLTKDAFTNKYLYGPVSNMNDVLPFTFENGKQYGSDYEIDNSTINNSFSINFNDLANNFASYDIHEDGDGSLSADKSLVMPIVYQPYISKTVTRTINVTNPDGTVKTIKQTAEINQNVGEDFDWKGHHGVYLRKDDAYVTDNNWTAYTVPNIHGYTATQSQVEAVAVDGNTTDQTVNISYTANKQSVNVNYVDVSDGNKVVHTTIVDGVTGGEATVPNELPAGYKLVDGQSVPKTIHFNADNNDDINIKVQHATVTVTPNSPKTPSDKLPDNPDKSYPSGVSESDLNKTITRTIKVTTPDGQTKTVAQTVKLTRTATVDEVTGEVTYGKWSTGQWGAYDVPSVAGYTATQTEISATPVDENTKDQTIEVSYTPNKQLTVVKYVDDKGQVVHTTTVNGVTDQTVKVPSEVPAGWTITNGQVPSEITFGANGHEPIEVTVAHQHVTVEPDHPQNNGIKLPDNPAKTFNGVEANDLNKTITRTIKVTTPDGQTKTVEQTVHLTRTADVDEVTGEVTYGNWTTGEWSNYDVPTVQGYTASQNEVLAAKVTGDTKDQTVTVTYTADQQKLIVNFIDDTTGQTLKTVNKDGLTNSDSNYNTKSDIQDYVNNHYRLVSDDTNGQNLVFDNDDSKTQTYNVHLAHNTHDINDSNTVTETIHYKLDNGQKAFDDYNAQLSFTRTGYNDEVTGQNHWNDWQATNGQTFNAVQSPSKEGYTPDKTSIEAINVNPGDKNIDTTVTYNANAQAAKISYIDDITGKTLKIDNANGKFNQAINFDNNVDSQIKDYEQQGYVLKSNNFSNQMYQADNAKNAFEVHLIHGTKNVQRTQNITETIQYQMEDGTKAPVTHTQSVDFTQDGVQDLVTKDIDWKATAPQQFKEVITPVMTGYTSDIASVPATTVNFGDKDINKVVTYKANAQTAKISYIDDNTGATLKTDNANGKFNQPISFDNNVDNQIKAFENQGYVLKSNSFNGQKYQANNNSNVFEVHLVHGTKNVQRTQKIAETINYQMGDSSKAPVTNTQSVDFTQDGVQDLVTNNIDWKATDPQQFKAVDSPAVTGYTPDITSVPATTVNFGDKDISKTVTYKANPQSAKITYIDDNTGKTLKVDNANGKFNQVIDFANMNSGIKDFENQGYVLKSNSFNGQKYQADNATNTFEVHFTHGTKNVQRQDTITETVKYQYDNGTLAHENNVQTLNFTQDGVQDLVTKNIDWKPTDAQEFKQVDTPAMDGYTPDITSMAATKVNFGDSDINKVVTYQTNNQTANIHYVDDMTGSFIGNDTANGKFDSVIDFGNVNDKINTFKNLGYQLVSNGFNGQTYQSDNSKNVYYVHFTHGMKNVQRNKQITETIKYQYENGQQAQPDSVQTVSFNENGSQDLVTKKINWFNDAPQQFKAVSTPAITGYTADIDNIPAVVVSYDNDNINKVVTYKANSQTAKINYIDDTTGKVIKTDTANGKFNQAISFSETPTNVINGLIKRGYKLVSNSFNGQTYQNDNIKNEFTVHLAHNTKNVSKQNTVTRTINYLDNNGKAIQAPIIETVTFTQNGTTDLVTGNTTWDTPSSQTFEAVASPAIKGFGKPDVEVVKPQTVNFNDQNVVVNVHYSKATTPTNVNDNTGNKVNDNTPTPTVDHNEGKLNPTTFTTNTHQTTPQAHTANNGGQQSITPQSVNKPSEQQTVANNGTKANTLPQTGNSNDNGTAIIGLGLLSGMLGLLGIKGKKKQD